MSIFAHQALEIQYAVHISKTTCAGQTKFKKSHSFFFVWYENIKIMQHSHYKNVYYLYIGEIRLTDIFVYSKVKTLCQAFLFQIHSLKTLGD